MAWVEIVAALALLQYVYFAILVSRGRTRYGIHAPAVSGHEGFERLYRVQMNTLELLVVLLPSLWLAAQHWSPLWTAGAGAVYLVGRMIYLRAYTRDPTSRSLGYAVSMTPVLGLLGMGLLGAVMAVFR
ncbi:MAPEG family protein [Ideonella azotifigens]|uniref:MAPEG family protein n=1 Tax=Ideonella azotifigens TaxID=513160 RepID=A0ABN1JSQ1_9BURK|nr:MAPEG family protein [Ideonella azotifigens]MCD2340943.1 MAPEG family protein [Ideonella azotifigens]